MFKRALVLSFFAFSASAIPAAQFGTVLDEQKISDTEGGFSGPLGDVDELGRALTAVGDLDQDGTEDLVAGMTDSPVGVLWFLYMNPDGTVKSHERFAGSSIPGGAATTSFGDAVAFLGDLDGGGGSDIALAVGDQSQSHGRVFILFFSIDIGSGAVTLINDHVISNANLSCLGPSDDEFGQSVAWLGDHDGDGFGDLAVGAPRHDDHENYPQEQNDGAIYILSLRTDGTVNECTQISRQHGNFGGFLGDGSEFGWSVCAVGDIDGDGIGDMVAGYPKGSSGMEGGTGGLWVVQLDSSSQVKEEHYIGQGDGGFSGDLSTFDRFGWSVACLGDQDGDGVQDLAVGSLYDDDGTNNAGAVWILFLDVNAGVVSVKAHQKISQGTGGFTGPLSADDLFGSAIAVADIDGNGAQDILVGAQGDDDGGFNRGAIWCCFLSGCIPGSATPYNGGGINANNYVAGIAKVGEFWTATVSYDVQETLTFILGYAEPLSGVILPPGELLVNPMSPRLFLSLAISAGSPDLHTMLIPNDQSLIGRKGYTQAGTYGPGGVGAFFNGVELTVGCPSQ